MHAVSIFIQIQKIWQNRGNFHCLREYGKIVGISIACAQITNNINQGIAFPMCMQYSDIRTLCSSIKSYNF
jgi:hypothetical protein